jgi:uncharacterized protein YbaR (Trm112 family)
VTGSADIAPELLAIIVCPACHGEVALTPEGPAGSTAQAELVCQGCGLAYPVRDGIPVLLVDEARPTR